MLVNEKERLMLNLELSLENHAIAPLSHKTAYFKNFVGAIERVTGAVTRSQMAPGCLSLTWCICVIGCMGIIFVAFPKKGES
ncbi:hypothetical protein evm_003604 [Chilo suppressalis]|nr:hypothetical protein evm_003604 [Chilo suppressalis]